jgi:hypothetical protein
MSQKENEEEVILTVTRTVHEVVAHRATQAEREGRVYALDEDGTMIPTVVVVDESSESSTLAPKKRKSTMSSESTQEHAREVKVKTEGAPRRSATVKQEKIREATDHLTGSESSPVILIDDRPTAPPTDPVTPAVVTPQKVRKPPPQFKADGFKSDFRWIEEMAHWLETGKGGQTKIMSDANARCVLRQVTKLAKGDGIMYPTGWPADVVYFQDTKVDLTFDFDIMLAEAIRYETKYGRDRGNGWLLRHPIKKLKMYQAYLGLQPSMAGLSRPVVAIK